MTYLLVYIVSNCYWFHAVLIFYGINYKDWDWAEDVSIYIALKLQVLQLLLQVLFCNEPRRINTETAAVKWVDYHLYSSISHQPQHKNCHQGTHVSLKPLKSLEFILAPWTLEIALNFVSKSWISLKFVKDIKNRSIQKSFFLSLKFILFCHQLFF